VFRHILAMACLFGSLGAGTGETVYDAGACDGTAERAVGYTLDPQFNTDSPAAAASGSWPRGSTTSANTAR
jgi:hypothetical protein